MVQPRPALSLLLRHFQRVAVQLLNFKELSLQNCILSGLRTMTRDDFEEPSSESTYRHENAIGFLLLDSCFSAKNTTNNVGSASISLSLYIESIINE